MKKIRVWDPLVRIVHWVLVICVFSNLFFNESGYPVHRAMGMAASVAVIIRIVWGFVGSEHARFSDWFPWPSRLFPYLKAMLRNEAPRHLGHNPAGAVMMLILMALILGMGVSGFLMTTDAFYEDETLLAIHQTLSRILVGAIVLHIAGALLESWRHRENLIASMIHGNKPLDPDNKQEDPSTNGQ